MSPFLNLSAAGIVLLAATSLSAAELSAEQTEFFEKKIAPILSDNCFKCHSQAEKIKGGLALDSREGMQKGGDDGAVIVPGDPAKSILLQRVQSKDPDEKMPPKEAALSTAQVADLTAWIKMGAPDPRTADASGPIAVHSTAAGKSHWSWQPVRPQPLPAVKTAGWAKTPVDQFVLAKLEEKGMTPSALADRATLIRRAYFDLSGLPPMPWEVQAFIDDKAPDAWEKVIDRLLASPRYGERWGRYWLDIARYSDTKGDTKKKDTPVYPDAWTYRDYVIDSFNQDKPYDRFILEQLAADKLDLGQDKRPLAALAFLTVGDRLMENKNDIINDRIDVVSKGFLGLTVSCARCHDHMFDPIPQKDYYSLHGIFASTAEPKDNPIIAAHGDAAQYQAYLKAREAALTEAWQFAGGVFGEIQEKFREHAGDFLMAAVSEGAARTEYLKKIGGRGRQVEEMLKFFRRGGGQLRRSAIFSPWAQFAQLSAGDWAQKSPAILAEAAGGGSARFPVNPAVAAMFKGKSPQSLEEVAGYYTALFSDVGKRVVAENGAASKRPPAQMAGTLAAPAKALTLPPVTSLASASKATGLANMKAAAVVVVGPAVPAPLSETAFASLRCAPFPRDPMADFDPEEDGRMLPQKAQTRLATLLTAISKIDLTHPGAPKRAMSVEDTARPVKSPVFIRGEANNRGEIVPHRFLEILSGPNRPEFSDGSGRLGLAQAIAAKSNPLTARVMVNRIWLHHFGEGIVTTPDDFGTQSAPPSHPELLDYLAAQFMQNGWSMKRLHKLIMTSAVYQQKSDTNAAFAQLDPDNRLLWRANIRRLEFEPVRDSLLYIAGKLDLKTGGQPVNILSEPYAERRSVYGFIDRGNLPEMMNHFDFANPGMPLGKRHETTVPQQALFMMNSPLMVEVTRKLLARPEMAQAKTDAQRVHALYWMIYQRAPRSEETELGLGFLEAAGTAVDADEAATLPIQAANSEPARRPFAKGGKPLTKEQRRAMIQQAQQNRRSFQLVNEGERVDRTALTPWEKYTHALLMANETVYYN